MGEPIQMPHTPITTTNYTYTITNFALKSYILLTKLIMPSEHKNRWELSMKADLQNILIPEPQHRVGPMGVSSGVSVRKLPMPCTEQIRLICMHYVNKCSGKYENNKLAGRYVHQMANEVMSQLSGVSAEIDVVGANVELMKQRIKEWEDNFPPSLTDIGHPKAIADLISKQKRKITDLQTKLDAEKKSHDKDVNDVLRSMNVQLQAARNSTFLERQQLSLAHQQDEEEHKQRMAINDHEHQRTIDSLKREHRQEISRLRQSLQQQYDSSISSLKGEASNRVIAVKATYENELTKLRKRYTQDVGTLEEHIQVLEEKLVQIHIDLNGEENIDDLEIPSCVLEPLRVSSFDPDLFSKKMPNDMQSKNSVDFTQSNDSFNSSMAQEEFVLRSPSSPTRSARDIISKLNSATNMSPAKQSSHSNQLSDVKRENRSLRTKMKETTRDYKELEKTISILSEERQTFDRIIGDWKENHDNAMRRISQLEEINEKLRSALLHTCDSAEFNPGEVWGHVRPLQHTDDFLQRADKRGL